MGYDNIDVPACTRHQVQVTNTPDVLAETSADLAFALLMSIGRGIVQGDRYVRRGEWRIWGPLLHLTPDIHGTTLGIVGMGRIGQAMARRARGFDMRRCCTTVAPDRGSRTRAWVRVCDSGRPFSPSDYVSVHVALTEATRHIIGAEQLNRMKRTGILINTGRGPGGSACTLRGS